MEYCCIAMEGALVEQNYPIQYESYTRSYYLEYGPLFKDKNTGEIVFAAVDTLRYCPWCGFRFPKDLIHEWTEVVKNKFNITDTLDKKQLKKIPEEYMTEEWWKKRGF